MEKKMLRTSMSGPTAAKVPRHGSVKSDQYWCESGLDQDGFCKMFIIKYIEIREKKDTDICGMMKDSVSEDDGNYNSSSDSSSNSSSDSSSDEYDSSSSDELSDSENEIEEDLIQRDLLFTDDDDDNDYYPPDSELSTDDCSSFEEDLDENPPEITESKTTEKNVTSIGQTNSSAVLELTSPAAATAPVISSKTVKNSASSGCTVISTDAKNKRLNITSQKISTTTKETREKTTATPVDTLQIDPQISLLAVLERTNPTAAPVCTVISTNAKNRRPNITSKYMTATKSTTSDFDTDVERHTWSKVEKSALERQFKTNINLGKVPCQADCLNVMRKEPCLNKFTWKNIKYAVKNLRTLRKKYKGSV